jgi:hypothetical protein
MTGEAKRRDKKKKKKQQARDREAFEAELGAGASPPKVRKASLGVPK